MNPHFVVWMVLLTLMVLAMTFGMLMLGSMYTGKMVL